MELKLNDVEAYPPSQLQRTPLVSTFHQPPHFPIGVKTVESESSTRRRDGDKGKWLDALFICMVLVSVFGLAYMLVPR